MEQTSKELLLKDLCARLPYGLKVKCEKYPFPVTVLYAGNIDEVKFRETGGIECIYAIKPYLFSLSSMTEEQAKEMQKIVGNSDDACIITSIDGLELWLNAIDTDPTIWLDTTFEVQDWLNKNHFDYRGLIEKGLAIDATGKNIY